MQNEGRKIMHLPELQVSCTCVRVPVVRSHSVSPGGAYQGEDLRRGGPESSSPPPPAAGWWTIWPTSSTPCRWTPATRTPCSWAASGDDLTCDNGLNIWCCGDQVRKGAATNAVQIAQLLLP